MSKDTFSLTVKFLILLQGRRLIYVPGCLIGGISLPYKAISFIHRKKNKEGGGKKTAAQTWGNTLFFIIGMDPKMGFIFIAILNLLAEPQCSCHHWCHPRTCFTDRLRWLWKVSYSSAWFKTSGSMCSFIWTLLILRGSSFMQRVLDSTSNPAVILQVLG